MRKKSVLIVLLILAVGVGLIGTGLSTLYKQEEYFGDPPTVTVKVSYGFPLGWQGYSWGMPNFIPVPTFKFYWFSFGPLLLDAAFWSAISFFVSIATMKSVNILHKTRASKNLSVIDVLCSV